jgi:hypothetical protein
MLTGEDCENVHYARILKHVLTRLIDSAGNITVSCFL